MSLRDWFEDVATATPATSATPSDQQRPPVAIVPTVAVATVSGDEHQLDYTPADLAEFDALIRRYCAAAVPELQRAAKLEQLLAARRRMRPSMVATEFAEFRALVAQWAMR